MDEKAQALLLERIARTEESLRKRFGEFIELGDLAALLNFPSTAAVQKARARGRLPVQVTKLPNRNRWVTTPRAVAELLAQVEESTKAVSGGLRAAPRQ